MVYLYTSQQKQHDMTQQQAQIGTEVVRSKGDYVVGRVGIIVAIDTEKNRAQVNWGTHSWVSLNALEPTSIPYEIIRREPKMVKGYMKHFNPQYIKK